MKASLKTDVAAGTTETTYVPTGTLTNRHGQLDATRDRWGNPAQFMLSCIGYSVGLGNVWRFPYLCYKHGGAAFLLVYLFLQLTIGQPLYFMELVAGQYSGKSAVRVWDMSPASRGIGFSMCLVSINISLYYNVIMAYLMYYFFSSFSPDLPWTTCKPEWKNCFTSRKDLHILPTCKDSSKNIIQSTNCTCSEDKGVDNFFPNCTPGVKHSTYFYFKREVLMVSDHISDFGVPAWKLVLLLLLGWIVVTACLIRGIKTSGKVVYFTATFPYIVLLLMLVRGLLLDGAMDGVELFLLPDWGSLGSSQLWVDAAGQMVFSLSVSTGGLIMYSSYNPFTHPVYRDAVIITTCDLVTSMLSGVIIFSTLGYMAKQTGKGILNVTESTYSLVFVAYPEIVSTLALPNLWSCLFFFMLFTLGLGTQFGLLETTQTFLLNDSVWLRRHTVILRVGTGVVLFLLGLPLICPGGQYLIVILDIYGSSVVLIVISMMETMTIMWVYGVHRFLGDIQYMLGHKPRFLPYCYFAWVAWSPLLLLALFVATVARRETPKYEDGINYGPGILTLCWLTFAYTILPVPLWFFLHLRAVRRRKGPFPTWLQFAKAVFEPSERWGPNDGTDGEKVSRRNPVLSDVLDWKVFQDTGPPVASARLAHPEVVLQTPWSKSVSPVQLSGQDSISLPLNLPGKSTSTVVTNVVDKPSIKQGWETGFGKSDTERKESVLDKSPSKQGSKRSLSRKESVVDKSPSKQGSKRSLNKKESVVDKSPSKQGSKRSLGKKESGVDKSPSKQGSKRSLGKLETQRKELTDPSSEEMPESSTLDPKDVSPSLMTPVDTP